MGTNDFLGEVNITLDSFIFHEDGEEAKWYPLGNKASVTKLCTFIVSSSSLDNI